MYSRKYKNRKTYRKVGENTYYFDSEKEARRFDELLFLQRAGKIKDLILQPSFIIVDSVKDTTGKKLPARKYIADFLYIEGDKKVVEDVKSPITRKEATYRLKRQLFLVRYGKDYIFREI